MNNFKKKNVLIKSIPVLAAAVFALVLLFSYFGAAVIFSGKVTGAKAEEVKEFTQKEISVANNDFASYSGSFPYVPSNWTEKSIPNTSKGSTVAGVLDLDTYNTTENIRTSKLDSYPEYATKPPVSPFGSNPGQTPGNRKFLMINTVTNTAYGYSSSGISIEKNKFYMVSVWTKTGDFADQSGAAIRLDGLNGNYAFTRINTVSSLPKTSDGIPDLSSAEADGMLGWKCYNFYIAGSPLATRSMTVVFSVGDYYSDKDVTIAEHATGYAFFDNITVHEISASNYGFRTSGSDDNYNKKVDLGLESAFTPAQEKIFNFSNNCADWTEASHNASDATHATGVIGGFDTAYGLENNPVSSTGTETSNTALNNLLLFSSYNSNTDSYSKTSIGKKSPALTIERFRYYRLSAWVYTNKVNGGSGASLIVTSDKMLSTEEDDYEKFTISNATGDTSDTARFGWKEYAFYIQGSSIGSNEITLELRLGSEDSLSEGTVLFHNVRFDRITSSEFTSYSSEGTLVKFDSDFADNNAGVTNGAFLTAGDYDEYKFPLAPASWTYIDAESAGTPNYSGSAKYTNSDDILSGIVPTDTEHFNSQYETYSPYNLVNKIHDVGTMLVISSLNSTAVGYRSSDITISAATSYKLTVNMSVDQIKDTDYGANIVLKNSSNKVIASIEKIKSTQSGNVAGSFQPFTFYIEGGTADNTVTVEIWLGLIDRADNSTKLSSGNVYVDTVSCAALGEGESYAAFESNYNSARSLNQNPPYAAVTFKSGKFDAFDYYDNNFVKYPYNWELNALGSSATSGVRYGIFDYTNIPAWQAEVPSTFKNPNASSNYVLMLNNTSRAATSLSYSGSFSLEASKRYKMSVTVKTDISYAPGSANTENSVGAGIVLSGTEFKFEDIRSTAEVIDTITDNEAFRTYSFYIINGAEATSLGVNITLGSGDYSAAYCAGRVYVNNVDFTEINDSLYEEVIGDLTDDELLEKYIIKADLTTPVEETPAEDTPNKINWWLVPSILFSVALIVVLAGVAIRKLADNIAAKRSKRVSVDTAYDRSKTIGRLRPDGSIDNDARAVEENDKIYEEFDDVLPPAPGKLKSRSETVEYKPAPKISKSSVVSAKDKTYDEFDDSIKTDEPEASIAETSAAESAEVKTEETMEAAAVNAEQAATTDKKEEPAAKEKIAYKPVKKAELKVKDPSMDEFDD